MTARARLGLYRAGGSLLPAALGIGVMGVLLVTGADVVPSFVAAIGALFASERLYPRLVEPRLRRRLLVRLNDQLGASLGEPRRARAIFEEISDGYHTLGLAPDLYLGLMNGIVLAAEGRASESRALLSSIDARTPDDREAVLRVMKLLGFSDLSPYR